MGHIYRNAEDSILRITPGAISSTLVKAPQTSITELSHAAALLVHYLRLHKNEYKANVVLCF